MGCFRRYGAIFFAASDKGQSEPDFSSEDLPSASAAARDPRDRPTEAAPPGASTSAGGSSRGIPPVGLRGAKTTGGSLGADGRRRVFSPAQY